MDERDAALIKSLREGWVWGKHGTFQEPDVVPLEILMGRAADRLEELLSHQPPLPAAR